MPELALPIMLLLGGCLIVLEHRYPAHPLEPERRWYIRAAIINAVQLLVFVGVDAAWARWAGAASLFALESKVSPVVGALLAYFIFTFVIYWWHRLRHGSDLIWRVFHQFHHSPKRIQTLTAYYIHPLDMVVALCISNSILFPLLGLGIEAAGWYTLITGFAGFFIHANIRVPRQVGYVFQTPEMHRLHHKSGHHAHNYSDIVCWDLLFGTYLNPEQPIMHCGFNEEMETDVIPMLLGKDLHAR
jgi:sterol desaturase/sphingolipid hydroxylase (fatty acid hydroxylase superfamily)